MSHCSKCSDDRFPCLVSQLRAGCNATANGSGCTEWSIYWTPAARNATAISTPTHTDRTTADGSRRWGRGRGGGQRRLDGRWASWLRKSAFRFCGSNEGDRGSSEGKAHPHHERVACCVWPTDHGLITRMAANKSKTPSPRDSWREETCHVETLMLLIGQLSQSRSGGSGEHGVWGHIPAAAPRPRLPARGGQCAATLAIQCLGGVMFVVVCTNTTRPTQERGLGIARDRSMVGNEKWPPGSVRCQNRTGPSSKLKRGPAGYPLLSSYCPRVTLVLRTHCPAAMPCSVSVAHRLSFHGLLPSLSAHRGGDFEAGTEAALSGEATWTGTQARGNLAKPVIASPPDPAPGTLKLPVSIS
jgi:hypothetical protein